MEKFPSCKRFESTDQNSQEIKKTSGLPMWVKAVALGSSLAVSHTSFAQEKFQKNDKNKEKIDLFQSISLYYNNVLKEKEKNFKYFDNINLSTEDKELAENYAKSEIIEYKNNIENPQKLYESILELTEEARHELLNHFSSKEFFKKLEINLDENNAFLKQAEIINNLKSVQIEVVNPDSIIEKCPGAKALALYSIQDHKVLIPFDTHDKYIIMHELIHSAYRASKTLSQKEKEILNKLYKENKEIDPLYQHTPAERIARKKALDLLFEKSGIIKYGQEFNESHYLKLQKLIDSHEVDQDVLQLFKTTSKKQLIKLINTIAFEKTATNSIDQNLA